MKTMLLTDTAREQHCHKKGRYIARLGKKDVHLTDTALQVVGSPVFLLPRRKTYHVVVITKSDMEYEASTFEMVEEKAVRLGYTKPDEGLVLVLAEQVSPKLFEEMGLRELVVVHRPIEITIGPTPFQELLGIRPESGSGIAINSASYVLTPNYKIMPSDGFVYLDGKQNKD